MEDLAIAVDENGKPAKLEDEVSALQGAFDETGITFKDRAASLAALKEGREIVWESGTPHVHYDQELLPLHEALRRFGFDRRDLVDGRTLPREGVGTSRPGTVGKDSFQTVQQKVEWIREHGLAAYEALPMRAVTQSKELATFEDWLALPIAERARLSAEQPGIIARLTRYAPPKVATGYVTKALERQRKINPNARFSVPGWSRTI